MELNFKEWLKLQEVGTTCSSGTSTADIAMFKRPIFGEPFRRSALFGVWGEEDPFFKRKKIQEHGGDPTAYGSTLGSDPDGQSNPLAPLKAQSSMAQTGGPGDQPTLMMPVKLMKRSSKKSKK